MSDPNIPIPFVGTGVSPGQWTHGEGLDDYKWHTRFDTPMDALGAIARGWGSQFASFMGVYRGAPVTGGVAIAFTPLVDTAGAWNTVAKAFVAPWAGRYILAGATRITVSTNAACLLNAGPTQYKSQGRVAAATRGSGISVCVDLAANDQVWLASVVSITSDVDATRINNYLAVQQVGW